MAYHFLALKKGALVSNPTLSLGASGLFLRVRGCCYLSDSFHSRIFDELSSSREWERQKGRKPRLTKQI